MIIYKLVSLLVSVLGGLLAGAIFKRIWKAAAGEDEAPKATDAQHGWREVLVAATLQAAISFPSRPEESSSALMRGFPRRVRPRQGG